MELHFENTFLKNHSTNVLIGKFFYHIKYAIVGVDGSNKYAHNLSTCGQYDSLAQTFIFKLN